MVKARFIREIPVVFMDWRQLFVSIPDRVGDLQQPYLAAFPPKEAALCSQASGARARGDGRPFVLIRVSLSRS